MSLQAKLASRADWQESFLFAMLPIIRDYLYTDPYFENFAIISEDMQNVPDQIDKCMSGLLKSPNGKQGCSIFIMTLKGGQAIQDAPATYSMSAEAVFLVHEMPSMNRGAITTGTGVPALVVAEKLMAIMKRFQSTEYATCFREPEGTQPVPYYDTETGLITHTVRMLFHGGVQDTSSVVIIPDISVDPATYQVTITCQTEGAVIYYTTDGATRPTREATEYTGPFDGSDAPVCWARAYRPGWRASVIAMATVAPEWESEDDGEAAILEESGGVIHNE